MSRADAVVRLEATEAGLQAAVFQHLGQPLQLAGPLLDQLFAVAGPLPQRGDLGDRDERGPQQPELVQLSDPLAIGDVPLAAGHVAHVRRVAHAHPDPGLHERVIYRPPEHASGLHRRVGDAEPGQPGRHLLQLPPERPEALHHKLPLARRLPGQPHRDPDDLLVHVDPGDARMDDIHRLPPCTPLILDMGAPPAEPAYKIEIL
jgi:hypothetical protein